MAQFLAPIINDQQVDANGNPLSGGKIFVYLAGSSTPVTTYSDKAGLVPNTNPITLNTLGVNTAGAVWLTGGAAYKYVIQNAALVTQRTIDNVSGIGDTAVTADQWVVYQAAPTYVSATSFTVAGDQTQTFQVGRRIKTVNTGGTVYGTITGSVYSAPNTTITVANDAGALDSGLSAVSYSVISVQATSLPGGLPPYGQCRLRKSGANLVLSPYAGNLLTINDAVCVIPSAGVSLAPTALSVGTTYFIYACITAGVLTLEASTTAHTTSTTTGMEIKTGDASRSLVGMARIITGPAWADTAAQRFVVSWFNRRALKASNAFTAGPSTTSATYTELNSAVRCEFLTWGDEALTFGVSGASSTSVATAQTYTAIGLDSTTVAQEGFTMGAQPAGINGQLLPVAVTSQLEPTEGYHFAAVLGLSSGGTSSWSGGATAGSRTAIQGVVRG